MAKRTVFMEEAAELLGNWGDRRLRPLCTPTGALLDPDVEQACDRFLRWLADDPERDLSQVPTVLLLEAWARVLTAQGLARMFPQTPVVDIAPEDEHLLLPYLIGGYLGQLRVPPERPAPEQP